MKKKILVTADFYSEFVLYETTDADDLKNWVRDMVNERFRPLDESRHQLIGSSDDLLSEDAINAADEVVYMGDLEED